MPWNHETIRRWNRIPSFRGIPCPVCGTPFEVRYEPEGRPGWRFCKSCVRRFPVGGTSNDTRDAVRELKAILESDEPANDTVRSLIAGAIAEMTR